MRGRGKLLLGAALSLGLIAAACGGSSAAEGDLTGTVVISGSSTVEPISALNAEKFAGINPGVQISVDGPGTGDGFELFCNGETDISDASRPIDEEEAAACKENGIEYVELEVAIDGIVVLTSPTNDAVRCLTFGDLYALLGPESEGFDSWADAEGLARDVGGTGGFPSAPLSVTAPGEESGTYDSFVELAIEDLAEERGEEPTTRPDYQASANDNVIIEGLAGSETSLGWVGYAFFVNNQDQVKALEVDRGDGCVAPTEETIADGSYPIARSLYIYVNAARAAENPAVAEYVDLYLGEEGIASVTEVGYVALPAERMEETRSAWQSAAA